VVSSSASLVGWTNKPDWFFRSPFLVGSNRFSHQPSKTEHEDDDEDEGRLRKHSCAVACSEIELSQLMGRIKLRIEQRGNENDLLGATPRDGNLKSYRAEGQSWWQLVKVLLAPVGQTLGWFAPQHKAIIVTQPAVAAKIGLATALMQPHEAVDAAA
jgi:hypothetical protein